MVFMGITIKTILIIILFSVMIIIEAVTIIEVVNMIDRALYYDKIEKYIDKPYLFSVEKQSLQIYRRRRVIIHRKK